MRIEGIHDGFRRTPFNCGVREPQAPASRWGLFIASQHRRQIGAALCGPYITPSNNHLNPSTAPLCPAAITSVSSPSFCRGAGKWL